jgi:hypothetical protein
LVRGGTSPLRRGAMPTHTYHDDLPGFSPEAVLHHGCEECESRAGIHGLGSLDWKNSRKVVERAVRLRSMHGGGLDDTNPTERKLLDAVWTVLVWLENNTELEPIQGELPWIDFERIERELFDRG